jgi:hypothetical protein
VTGRPGREEYRALICITTCQRQMLLARHLPHFANLTARDPRFSLLVAIDGTEPETLAFCSRWNLPAVYSDEREGVGISKNRALKQFPDFDYYFFVEDDVELVDADVFSKHVRLFEASGIHHFSLFERGGTRNPVGSSTVLGVHIVHCRFGAASFNFFTRESLERVGGWHPMFATYRRWGHTEHSYRIYRAGLAPAPFNVAEDLTESFIWHVPPGVTRVSGVRVDADQIAEPERELMDQGLSYVPVETVSRVRFNGAQFGQTEELVDQLRSRGRYPLVGDGERRRARSDFDLWRFRNEPTLPQRAGALVGAVTRWPSNPAFRHAIKTALLR